LKTAGPVFEFIHFNLPHSPFIYDGDRYAPAADPWLQNEDNYVKQVKHVDYLVGRFLAAMEKQARFTGSDVIIMSDHGYRALAPKGQAHHVPLLIKRAGQARRRDHDEPVQTEVILRSLVSDTAAARINDSGDAPRS
jgi:arylsulfatase A-like enzyme